MKINYALLLLLLVGLLIITIVVSLGVGSVSIPALSVVHILLGKPSINPIWQEIIWQFRVPKVIAAILAGSALSVSGLQMQTLFENPLAEPFILGISSGASLGVAMLIFVTGSIIIAPFLQEIGIVGAAFLGSLFVFSFILWASRRVQNNGTLLILGLMIGYATTSLISVMIQFGSPDRLQRYVAWSGGSFAGISPQELVYFGLLIAGSLLFSLSYASTLNVLLLGEAQALSVGLNVQQTRLFIILSSSFLAGTVTAYCGPIGFLGVAVPHLCRGLFRTPDHRWLLPASAITGALLATLADLLAQVGGGRIVLPLNAVTALFGTPVVVWIVLGKPCTNGRFL